MEELLGWGLSQALSDSQPLLELVTPKSGLECLRGLLHMAMVMGPFQDMAREGSGAQGPGQFWGVQD